MTTSVAPTARDRALRTARRLNVATLGWNIVEAVVALSAALAAGSLSLLAFGMDSCIEVSGALVLSWRLARERREGCRQPDDRRATRVLAISFFALAGYVGVQSVLNLVRGDEPSASTVG
ncbi:MAG: cation transporter, partial [Sporichthyaceae bacterium]